MTEKDTSKLQFVPFSSTVSPGFWYKLVNKKLNEFKLNDESQSIVGSYTNSEQEFVPCRHSIEYNAFEGVDQQPRLCQISHGELVNKNTLEEFRNVDKKQLLQTQAEIIWEDIKSGRAVESPSLLVRFILISFADLKKYHFYYWFGFPAFLKSTDNIKIVKSSRLKEEVGDKVVANIVTALDVYRAELKSSGGRQNEGFFIVNVSPGPDTTSINKLSDFDRCSKSATEIWFGFSDPSTLPHHPGWQLRNFLLLIAAKWGHLLKGNVKILCLRDRTIKGVRNISDSLLLQLNIDLEKQMQLSSPCPDAIGWERNKNNKLCPRFVNLADAMDPVKLAESAVDLNLKLMKWRLLPSIDLEKISNQRCLLLGAGTLGCNVARALLGWGVKKITLLDNGTVSFSNPVRQTLYEFSDCSTSGGRAKAIAAAEKLRKIFPGVDATGIRLSIPMPGHPVNTNEKTFDRAKADVGTLANLIENHDVIFLLMDSRESRWLPTIIAAANNKLVINSALGFDSYLVMRHGVNKETAENADSEVAASSLKSHDKLGCYFCNDVVAPGNSTRDRTLDQQCTVSRPGISMIASALAVELFVSVTQHQEEGRYDPPGPGSAIPESLSASNREDFPLGMIPHQIRGFVSQYYNILPTTYSFSKCTACSDHVLRKYKEDDIDFLMEVFNSPPSYLEDVTGLTQLHQETALAEDEILEFSDNESI